MWQTINKLLILSQIQSMHHPTQMKMHFHTLVTNQNLRFDLTKILLFYSWFQMTLATVFAYLQAAFCALQKLYQHNVYISFTLKWSKHHQTSHMLICMHFPWARFSPDTLAQTNPQSTGSKRNTSRSDTNNSPQKRKTVYYFCIIVFHSKTLKMCFLDPWLENHAPSSVSIDCIDASRAVVRLG